MYSLETIRRETEKLVAHSDDGAPLDPISRALITLAVRVSVTSINRDAIREAIDAARAAEATNEQIHEIIALVSGLGVHSFMISATMVEETPPPLEALDDERRALWNRYVGDNPYWAAFELELPGFLRSLLALSPASFQGFFDYCAIAWSTRTVPAVIKELAAAACDATPQHRFGPGFRMHIANAVKLGSGRIAVLETLAIAAAAPDHAGVA